MRWPRRLTIPSPACGARVREGAFTVRPRGGKSPTPSPSGWRENRRARFAKTKRSLCGKLWRYRTKPREVSMAEAAVKTAEPAAEAERELTDGFQLVIDALKLNGINTIYGVPGIPITDLGRMAQAAGMRVISFRHEQNAG